MERNVNTLNSEALVRKLTSERERFVSAWQQGAGSSELNEIRENIKELNDLLWETTSQHATVTDFSGTGFKGVRKTG